MGKVLGRTGSCQSWSDVVKGGGNSSKIRGEIKIIQTDKQNRSRKNCDIGT